MNNKNVIIICLLIILCAIIVFSVLFISAKDTQLTIDLTEINQGDNLTISLTDINGNPLANKNVHVTINNVTYNLTTDKSGCCQFPINLEAGEYNIEVTFEGDLLIKSSSITQPLKVVNPTSQSSSSQVHEETNIEKYNRAGSMSKEEFYSTIVIHNADGSTDVMQEDGTYKHYPAT